MAMYRFNRISVIYLMTLIPLVAVAQTEEKKEMPQYLFPSFTECDMLMRDGQKIKQVMNYNLISEKMVYQQGGKFYDIMNPALIDTVFMNGSKFIPSGKIFHEVVLAEPLALFVQHKANLVTAGKPVGYG